MKNLKFSLLVIIILAAIPILFYAHIKHESPTLPDKKEKVLEATGNETFGDKNYITVLTVNIAH